MSESVPPVQPATPIAASSTRGWEMLCHLSCLPGMLGMLGGIPFGNVLGPLLVWLVKRHDSVGVDAHGRESVNFHLSWTLYAFVAGLITTGLMWILIGFLMLPFLIVGLIIGWITMFILTIIASIKASNGQLYRYPLTIRFL